MLCAPPRICAEQTSSLCARDRSRFGCLAGEHVVIVAAKVASDSVLATYYTTHKQTFVPKHRGIHKCLMECITRAFSHSAQIVGMPDVMDLIDAMFHVVNAHRVIDMSQDGAVRQDLYAFRSDSNKERRICPN